MSNHARLRPGHVPAAFSAAGEDVPPSPDVERHDLAQVIGQSVAYHVAQLLAPVLQRIADQQEQPGCIVCAAKAKRAGREHEIAVANARAAAEPEPERPGAKVGQSFTDGARGPVCWSCYDPGQDGPFNRMARMWDYPIGASLPGDEPPRQSGLDDVAGRPIAARR